MDREITRFTHYVSKDIMPVTQVEVRETASRDAVLALTSHAPSCGISYCPVEDLIISFVLVANHSSVVRDIGTGQKQFTEASGCIIITPPFTPSYWYFESRPLVLHVTVPSHKVAKFVDLQFNKHRTAFTNFAENPVFDPLASHLASRIWSALEHKNTAQEIFSAHALDTLLSILCVQKLDEFERGEAPLHSALAPWRLKKVTNLIMGRLDQKITIEEMAKSVELSADHFLRSFAATTGRTPHQWVTEMRIERAKLLMCDSSSPITEIALEIGYSSPAHFSSRFRQIVGLSPSEWRKTFCVRPA